MRIVVIAAIAAGLALALAAPASALRFEAPRLPGSAVSPDTVPVLVGALPVGDAVVYAAGSHARGWTVWLAAPGVPRRQLAVIAPVVNSSGDEIVLHASPTRLVVTHHAEQCDDLDRCSLSHVVLDELLAGPLGGPLARLCPGAACGVSVECSAGGTALTAALDGDLLAVRDGCTHAASVINLATGASQALGPAGAVAVAGPYVAVAGLGASAVPPDALTTIDVRDAASGAQVYRPDLPAINLFGAPQFALLPDGTLAYVAPAAGAEASLGGAQALVVASPATPAGRVVRAVASASTIHGIGPAGVLTFEGAGVQLLPLDGGPSPLPVLAIPNLLAATFDGHTIVVTQGLCVTKTVTSWQLGDPVPAPADVRCPTALPARTPATLRTDSRLRVAVSCPAITRGGCQATIDLTALRRPRRHGQAPSRRSYPLGSTKVALDPGASGPVDVLVAPRAARWVRSHAPLRLQIAVHNDLCCPEHRPPGDPGTATRTVQLVATR